MFSGGGRAVKDEFSFLLPAPMMVVLTGGVCSVSRVLTYRHSEEFAANAPLDWLRQASSPLSVQRIAEGRAFLEMKIEGERGEQAYVLDISGKGIEIAGGGPTGLVYGLATLVQIIGGLGSVSGEILELPCLHVEGAPDFVHRGVMLDVGRNKVARVETLFHLVGLLARFKINQIQLYTEHTFAYAGHERVWRDASPLTPDEIRALDGFCRDRFVELVPNQQSFGHMHRWLVHEPYRGLAECPEGVDHAFSTEPEPFSLCPEDPGSLALLDELYSRLLPCFTSPTTNVGMDETFDLGMGRSADACTARGKTEVYLEFLGKVRDLAARHGKRIQFWGDIIIKRPDLVASLPKDAIALEWGYEADHPFAEHARVFGASGLDFYVCPGTSAWCSFTGRTENMLVNVREAARQGKANGARGFLMTDWGDYGHHQPLPVSYPGFLAGAARAWSADASTDRLAEWLDRYVFDDERGGTGQWLLDLGNTYRCFAPVHNGHPLFFLIRYAREPLDQERLQVIDRAGLTKLGSVLEDLRARLPEIQPRCADGELVRAEFSWCLDMITWCARLATARLEKGELIEDLDAGVVRELAPGLAELVARHREQWLVRNREGGLDESCARLENIFHTLS
jgi:hypothetical protein